MPLIRPLCALGLLMVALAPIQGARAEPAAAAHEMRTWLMRIHSAASHRNFQGTFVVSGGGSVASARIAHYCDGSNQYERIESLDGPARQVFRHNDMVRTIWPGSRVAQLEQRDLLSTFPALLQAGDDHIQDVYEVRRQATETLGGQGIRIAIALGCAE
jgi:sigma-E factor negative regulatory protein RseB